MADETKTETQCLTPENGEFLLKLTGEDGSAIKLDADGRGDIHLQVFSSQRAEVFLERKDVVVLVPYLQAYLLRTEGD